MLRDICSLMGTPAVAVPARAVNSEEEPGAGAAGGGGSVATTGVTTTSTFRLISCSDWPGGWATSSWSKFAWPR